MSKSFKNTWCFIACLSFIVTAFAQDSELTAQLVESRLLMLRANDAEPNDETSKAYQATRTWLRQATTHERDAATYIDALTSAPQRENAIQLRLEGSEILQSPTVSYSGLSIQELSEQIRLTRTELSEAENTRDSIDQGLANRETNANLNHSRLEKIDNRLGELAQLDILIDPQASPSLNEALQWSDLAEQSALAAEKQALQARISSQPVRYSALRAERAELAIKIEALNQKERNLGLVSRSKTPIVADFQSLGVSPDSPTYAIARQTILSNDEFRSQRETIEVHLDELTTSQVNIESQLLGVSDRFATARRVVDFASDSDILGELLLAHWEELHNTQLLSVSDELPQKIGNTIIQRIANEEALARLVSSSSYVGNQIKLAGLEVDTIPVKSRDILITLARSQRELLRALIAVESNYIDALSESEASQRQLTELVHDYKAFLGSLILWVPSRPLLWKSNFADLPEEFGRLKQSLAELRPEIHPVLLLTFFIASLLFLTRSRLQQWQSKQHIQPSWLRESSIHFTLVALIATTLRALPIPLFLLAIQMSFAHQDSLQTTALSNTIIGLSVMLFALTFMKLLCDRSGIAMKHFGWNQQSCKVIFDEANWLARWWLPFSTIASFLFMLNDETVILGRLFLLLSISVLIAHLVRQHRKVKDLQQTTVSQKYVRTMLIILLLLLAGGIIWGLRYSVSVMTTRLVLSLWVGIALLLSHNIIVCWLRAMGRRMSNAVKEAGNAGEQGTDADENAMLADISADSTRLLNTLTMAALFFAAYYVWEPLFPALDALAKVSLWQSTSIIDGVSVITQITLETLVVIVFLAGVTIYTARKLPALVELILHSRTRVSSGSRFAVSTLLSYVIVAAGFLTALSALGLRWSQMQWLIAALGIGIGFGLQEIIANFISGLIILFERPIRVGDFISVGSMDGVVTKIHIRATTIKDRDGKELVVPNKEFITGQLLNWTLSDPHVRIYVPVGIAYGSDVESALKILGEVARDNPNTLSYPKPRVVFEKFGDNALELTLRCYIADVEDMWPVTSELHRQIYKQFATAGIVIAFPQRDIHFDADQPINIRLDQAPQE